MSVNIALDGPSGSGKSTMAKRISKELGYYYIDTGALYRTIALFIKREDVCPDDESEVLAVIDKADVKFSFIDGVQHTYLGNEDVSEKIRTPEISDYASRSSSLGCVREKLLDLQRDFAKTHDLIMDGRDIATTVLPDAAVKIYLTASVEDRARRRCEELVLRGEKVDYDTVLSDMIERDNRDMSRKISPLKKSDDAVLVDTSGLALEEGYLKLFDTIRGLLEQLK